MRAISASVCLFAIGLAAVYATYGLDLSQPCSVGTFQCLHGQGYDFAIIRGWESIGQVDTACYSSVPNAWAAGFAHVDVYFFPCWDCGNAAGQVQTAVNSWRGNGVQFGMMWFDIETPCGDCGSNADFLSAAISQAEAMGVVVGIYASEYMWGKCMCGASQFSGKALWYADWDNAPNFDDFGGFGGWGSPAMKQMTGDSTVCGFDIDNDWYPDGWLANRFNGTVLASHKKN